MKNIMTSTALLLLLACGIPSHQADKNLADLADDKAYTGQFADADTGTNIKFRTLEIERGLAVEIVVNDKPFTFDLNQEESLRSFDGGGAVLTADERGALTRMARHLSTNDMQNFANDVQVIATYTGAEYLSQAPDGHAMQSRSFEPKLGLVNEGITCIKKGTAVKAEWRDRNNQVYAEKVVVGVHWPNNYGCMGRCGADCGNWWAASSWTKDCMDHDVCSFRHNASGGASDPNCEETYKQAADDWFWGVWAGCSG